jgi:hypothetical protein
MEDLRAFAREVDLLEQIQAELAAVATRNDDQRRYDLIELRRKLAAQIARVGQLAEPLMAERADPDALQIYRTKFSRMRSAAAMHQANWPAVALGERDSEYRASALEVREANREFVAWMRAAVAQFS